MFWTNWNEQHPSIMRAALSGANALTLIEKDIRTPNGLAIDHRAEKLYFSDATLDKIERCEYDGSHRYVSLRGRRMDGGTRGLGQGWPISRENARRRVAERERQGGGGAQGLGVGRPGKGRTDRGVLVLCPRSWGCMDPALTKSSRHHLHNLRPSRVRKNQGGPRHPIQALTLPLSCVAAQPSPSRRGLPINSVREVARCLCTSLPLCDCIGASARRLLQRGESARGPRDAGTATALFPQVILKSEPVHPFGLAVYGEHIFWTDWVRRAVQRANKYVGSDMKLLRVDIPQQPMGIIAVANDTNSCEWGRCTSRAVLPVLPACTHMHTHTLTPATLLWSHLTPWTSSTCSCHSSRPEPRIPRRLIAHSQPRLCLHHQLHRVQTTPPHWAWLTKCPPHRLQLSRASRTGPGAPITYMI